MRAFLFNILLALAWVALSGAFSGPNLLMGLVVSFVLLAYAQRITGRSQYFSKVPMAVGFALFVLKELLRANMRVAFDVVTPRHRMRPGVVAIPLDAQTDAEITLLANLITLTPGTLSLDVSTDRRVLYVHAMYITDAESLRSEIKNGFERRVLELLR